MTQTDAVLRDPRAADGLITAVTSAAVTYPGVDLPGGVPERADWIVEQRWQDYTDTEHRTWRTLFDRMARMAEGRTCSLFHRGLRELPLRRDEIPDFRRLSDDLGRHTGWQVVPVPGLVPDDVFFEHLANRRFPATVRMRSPDELDYQEYPDLFHDVFGHVPLLMFPEMAEFMQQWGIAASRAHRHGMQELLARVYWYTVEVGLVMENGALRSFGAAISSSSKEILFALEDPSPNRFRFDLERVVLTDFHITDLQSGYFVLDELSALTSIPLSDFDTRFAALRERAPVSPAAVLDSDSVIQRGRGTYHRGRREPDIAVRQPTPTP